MLIIPINLLSPDTAIIRQAVDVLRAGGVVAHPTDTCYGLAVSVLNKKAVRRLYELKNMDVSKPVSVMVSDVSQVEFYAQVHSKAYELMSVFWPGALTVILPRSPKLPSFFNQDDSTVGFRMPNCVLSLALVRAFGDILTTTSANISGQPSTYSASAIVAQFENQKIKPDLILDSGVIPPVPASTVVRIDGDEVRVLRQGGVKLAVRN